MPRIICPLKANPRCCLENLFNSSPHAILTRPRPILLHDPSFFIKNMKIAKEWVNQNFKQNESIQNSFA